MLRSTSQPGNSKGASSPDERVLKSAIQMVRGCEVSGNLDTRWRNRLPAVECLSENMCLFNKGGQCTAAPKVAKEAGRKMEIGEEMARLLRRASFD